MSSFLGAWQIENQIKLIWNENKLLKNHEESLIINNKVIELFKYMIFVLDKLTLKNFEQKSSQSFQALFNTVANLILWNKKVLSYQLKAPFNFFKNIDFSQKSLWFGIRDSNPWCQIQSLEPYRLANSEKRIVAILLKILYNQINIFFF